MTVRSRPSFCCRLVFSLLVLGVWPYVVDAQEQVNVDGRVTLSFSGYVLNRATNTCDVWSFERLLVHIRYFPSGEKTGSTSAPGL